MIKKSDKAGQFYLLAAVIIIGLFVGLFAVVNYSKPGEPSKIYDLAEELKVESANILDLGATSGNYPWQSFTKNFSDYAPSSIEIIYIVGNFSSIEAYRYDEGGAKEPLMFYEGANSVIVDVEATNYSFKKMPGENFHFVLYEKIGDEKHVAIS